MALAKIYSVGDRIWVPHDEDAWLAARIEKVLDSAIEVSTERGPVSVKPPSYPSRYEPCGSHIGDNVENLVDLDELSEGAILHHVRKRFKKKNIYTYVGQWLTKPVIILVLTTALKCDRFDLSSSQSF